MLRNEAKSIREFLRTHSKRTSDADKGPERKSNLTDNDSAKMASAKGVIQGYTEAATVDSACQIIVAAHAHGSGSEQSLLLPMIERALPYADKDTVKTADAGYHSEANLKQLHEQGIAALIADGLIRRRDERFREQARHKSKPDPLANKAPLIKSLPSGRFQPATSATTRSRTPACVRLASSYTATATTAPPMAGNIASSPAPGRIADTGFVFNLAKIPR